MGEDCEQLVHAKGTSLVEDPHDDSVRDVAVVGGISVLGADSVDPGSDLLGTRAAEVEEHAFRRQAIIGQGDRGSGRHGQQDETHRHGHEYVS